MWVPSSSKTLVLANEAGRPIPPIPCGAGWVLNFMRLSLKERRTRGVVLCCVQEIRGISLVFERDVGGHRPVFETLESRFVLGGIRLRSTVSHISQKRARCGAPGLICMGRVSHIRRAATEVTILSCRARSRAAHSQPRKRPNTIAATAARVRG